MSPEKNDAVQLIPLLCVQCRAPVAAQVNEVAWVCEQCGCGLLLDARRGTVQQTIFFSSSVPAGSKGRPFWVVRGQVTISARDTYKGDEGRAAGEFWGTPRLFFVPAWECALDEVLETGKALLKKPLGMTTGSPVPFLPVVTLPTDLQALGEFLVLSIEAERKDYLKNVTFTVSFEPPQLWILP